MWRGTGVSWGHGRHGVTIDHWMSRKGYCHCQCANNGRKTVANSKMLIDCWLAGCLCACGMWEGGEGVGGDCGGCHPPTKPTQKVAVGGDNKIDIISMKSLCLYIGGLNFIRLWSLSDLGSLLLRKFWESKTKIDVGTFAELGAEPTRLQSLKMCQIHIRGWNG